VSKEFVTAATSYILSVSCAAPAGKGAAAAKKIVRKNKPLWDGSKIAVGQWLSQTQYYHVKAIEGTRITVENQWGNLMLVSKDIIEKMDSADHFEKEVGMNMTALAELLETLSDTIFQVNFRKQPNKDDAVELLKAAEFADLKDKAKLAALSKGIIEGQPCNMICHLVKAENLLGRSTVIDLTAKTENKFRQIDHRTIESIIYKNVKYSLKKGAKRAAEDEEEKKDSGPKWDSK
jgi:hypothetical protein